MYKIIFHNIFVRCAKFYEKRISNDMKTKKVCLLSISMSSAVTSLFFFKPIIGGSRYLKGLRGPRVQEAPVRPRRHSTKYLLGVLDVLGVCSCPLAPKVGWWWPEYFPTGDRNCPAVRRNFSGMSV